MSPLCAVSSIELIHGPDLDMNPRSIAICSSVALGFWRDAVAVAMPTLRAQNVERTPREQVWAEAQICTDFGRS